MNFQPVDRLPIVEWAPWWDQTIARWHKEGLPATVTENYDITRHFGLDMYYRCRFSAAGPGFPKPSCHGGAIVSSEEDYERLLEHLYPWPPPQLKEWATWAEEQRRGEAVLLYAIEGFFWFPRVLLGIEPHFYAFYDKPEFMHRINADMTAYHLKVLDAICEVAVPDFMAFNEDMSYNHGPMLSKELFDEFMRPYYLQVVPAVKERGIIPIVDSDGDITVPASWFEEVGADGMLPLERQAGVDVAALRKDHPRMRIIGAYDKMVMNRGEAAMRAEFERLLPVARQGGFIIGCDHQTPPGVSYDDYQLYLKLFREYADSAGNK